MLSYNSIHNLFFNSKNSLRRRKQIRSSMSSPETLECRRLLTNAAPTLANIVAEDGTIEAVVQDDQSYGDIEITVDFDGDGIDDVVMNASEGESISIDVSSYIPANETDSVTIVIKETYNNEEAGSTDILINSVTVQAAGVSIPAMNFAWLSGAFSNASGAVENAEQAVAELSVMWREVGDTQWEDGGNVDSSGLVFTYLPTADGERDFEFVVVHGGVMGGTVTLYDVSASSGEGESSGGDSNSGDGGGWGWGGDDGDDGDSPGLFD